jgi:Chromo (CHRromatin Organisation MOdifier) domain
MNKKETYIIEKIVDKKTEDGKNYFLIKWKNFNNAWNSWEPEAELVKDGVKPLIDKYHIKMKTTKPKGKQFCTCCERLNKNMLLQKLTR